MSRLFLELRSELYEALMGHLLPLGSGPEQAAFIFARQAADPVGDIYFQPVGSFLVPVGGFAIHSRYHIELSDEVRASIIKRAHDLDASIVEFHSHPFNEAAEFSPSDRMGLEEFVPHVQWRLKKKPYVAVVVAPSGFDALAWVSGTESPSALDAIVVGEQLLRPTGLTLLGWGGDYE